ncbi:hypothetical protein DPEC_G00272690 [Dallia pectoralis]|uniref:Uncharacterized protein n=1 Tax=Dallia pectoralis TaxID=75939 RepID=A0ACC2FQ09_DALPE|nr:hypothetical protein DPEC_G00272690 [Dallia pectoralis]
MNTEEWTGIFQSKVKNINQNRGHSWCIEFDSSIESGNQASGWHQYIRGAFGRFQCSKCNRRWSSGRVQVIFHMRRMSRQGTVKVRAFRQNCTQCDEAPMEEASFEKESLEVLLEKLMEKISEKCYGQKKRKREYDNLDDNEGPPHESSHCEACSKGICTKRFKR